MHPELTGQIVMVRPLQLCSQKFESRIESFAGQGHQLESWILTQYKGGIQSLLGTMVYTKYFHCVSVINVHMYISFQRVVYISFLPKNIP